jgi:ParB family transcriptional regulator, chromosome partitioning protein
MITNVEHSEQVVHSPSTNILDVEIGNIITDNEGTTPPAVADLMESIESIGLLQPIGVKKEPGSSKFRTVFGHRRLAAFIQLGKKTIPCLVTELEGPTAELAAIDENLQRQEFTALQRADLFTRRKEIYETLHPEAKRPKGGRRATNGEIISSFTADTAEKAKQTQPNVQLYIQIDKKITKEAKDAIRGTGVDDVVVNLQKLSRLKPPEQLEEAHRLVTVP